MTRASWLGVLLLLLRVSSGVAQQSSTPTPSVETNAAVPRLVNFSGTLTDLNGKPLTGVQGVTFEALRMLIEDNLHESHSAEPGCRRRSSSQVSAVRFLPKL